MSKEDLGPHSKSYTQFAPLIMPADPKRSLYISKQNRYLRMALLVPWYLLGAQAGLSGSSLLITELLDQIILKWGLLLIVH